MGRFGYHVIDADGHGGEFANWRDSVPDAHSSRAWPSTASKIKKHYGQAAAARRRHRRARATSSTCARA